MKFAVVFSIFLSFHVISNADDRRNRDSVWKSSTSSPAISDISKTNLSDTTKHVELRSKKDNRTTIRKSNESLNVALRNFDSGSGLENDEVHFTKTDNTEQSCKCVAVLECLRSPQDESDGVGIIAPKNAECSYQEICCPLRDLVHHHEEIPPFNESPHSLSAKCGERRATIKLNNRIASPDEMKNTIFGEFPWMALILTKGAPENGKASDNVFVCGASVLSPNILLTAAHCVQNKDQRKLKVRAGDYDVRKRTVEEFLPFQERGISKVICHPDFNPKTLHNDLALIVTTKPFTMAGNIFPVCSFLLDHDFADPNIYDPSYCIATGWGKDSFAPEAPYSTTLKKVDLHLVTHDDCLHQLRNTRLGPNFVLNPSFMCAGGQHGMDTCKGDGGGPLMCAIRNNPNQYVQVGVTSWGIGCGNEIPAVYASLKANLYWLLPTFNEHSIALTTVEIPEKPDYDSYSKLTEQEKYKLIFETNEDSFEPPECHCVAIEKCEKPRNIYGEGIIDPKSNSYCDNPHQVCCEVITKREEKEIPQSIDSTRSLLVGRPKPVVIENPSCGVRQINGVGFKSPASNTLFGEFPWMVAIFEKVLEKGEYKLVLKCSGSLIHEKVVLTAAHCIIGNTADQIILRAGEWDVENINEVLPHQDREAAKLHTCPSYNSGSLHNDIGLVVVNHAFTITENVATICLPTRADIVKESHCLVAGWGRKSHDLKTYSSILKMGKVTVAANAECENKVKSTWPDFKFHESWICGEGNDVCKGDGGGPLICLIAGESLRYQQVGVISWGYGCGNSNPYVMYTNVALYQKWIDEVFGECGISY